MNVKLCFKEMDLDQNDYLSFFNLVEIMNKLGYIEKMNEPEKSLLNIMWSNISTEITKTGEIGIT